MLENRKIDWIFDYLFKKGDCSKDMMDQALEIREAEQEEIKKNNIRIREDNLRLKRKLDIIR